MYANRTRSEHQTSVRNLRRSQAPLAESERGGWQREQLQHGSEKRMVAAVMAAEATGTVWHERRALSLHRGRTKVRLRTMRRPVAHRWTRAGPSRESAPEALSRATKLRGQPTCCRRPTDFARCRSTYEASGLRSLNESQPRVDRSRSVHGPWRGRAPPTAPRSGCRPARRAACRGSRPSGILGAGPAARSWPPGCGSEPASSRRRPRRVASGRAPGGSPVRPEGPRGPPRVGAAAGRPRGRGATKAT